MKYIPFLILLLFSCGVYSADGYQIGIGKFVYSPGVKKSGWSQNSNLINFIKLDKRVGSGFRVGISFRNFKEQSAVESDFSVVEFDPVTGLETNDVKRDNFYNTYRYVSVDLNYEILIYQFRPYIGVGLGRFSIEAEADKWYYGSTFNDDSVYSSKLNVGIVVSFTKSVNAELSYSSIWGRSSYSSSIFNEYGFSINYEY